MLFFLILYITNDSCFVKLILFYFNPIKNSSLSTFYYPSKESNPLKVFDKPLKVL